MTPDFSTQEEIFGKLLGPMRSSRAATNGIILRHGYIVAEWGDTQRADPTRPVPLDQIMVIYGGSIREQVKRVKSPGPTRRPLVLRLSVRDQIRSG